MKHVVFVVPFALETTLRFVRSMLALPDVRVGILSQEAAASLPGDVRARIEAHKLVGDPMDADELMKGVQAIARDMGGRVHRLVGILEQMQEPLATVRERLGIRGMAVAEAVNFRDKALMKDVLRANGLPCAQHCLATSKDEALAFTEEILPLVVKPPAGAGARDTFRVDSRDDLAGYLRVVPPTEERPLLLEEFVQGEEHSFDSVSIGGEHVFHSISRYYPTPLEVMRNPWLQWCVILPREIDGPEYDDIRDAGRRALDALGMVTGMTHMEWFRRKDGSIAISEVAARPPGAQFTSLISFAHGIDFYDAWARMTVHERFEPPQRSYAVGALFLRGQGGERVTAVEGIEEARDELGPMIVQAKIPKPGQPAATSYEGEGFIIVRHAETKEVERAVRRLFQLIKVELGARPATRRGLEKRGRV